MDLWEKSQQRLVDGNARYVRGDMAKHDHGARRKDTAGGQKPFAAILYCSDSRVPIEYVFDAGIGELFGIRVAGNIADEFGICSMEYAVECLGIPLIVVLGHTSCGAIGAACGACRARSSMNAVAKALQPAVEASGGDPEKAVLEEVALQIANIRKASPGLSGREGRGEIRIVGAVYDIKTGVVRFL